MSPLRSGSEANKVPFGVLSYREMNLKRELAIDFAKSEVDRTRTDFTRARQRYCRAIEIAYDLDPVNPDGCCALSLATRAYTRAADEYCKAIRSWATLLIEFRMDQAIDGA
jgi:hypothetical protein